MDSMFGSSIREIEKNPALRWYGAALAAVHAFTLIFWLTPALGPWQDAGFFLEHPVVMCWPFFPSCEAIRPWFLPVWKPLMAAYAGLTVAGIFFFVRGRVRAGTAALWALTVLKLVFVLQDYRMQGNYHTMPLLATLAYLALPRKIPTIKVLIVAFYVAAGLVKLDVEWLSGAAIGAAPLFSGKILEWAAAYVVVLELAIAPLLLARRRSIFVFAFAQFVVFHLYSWSIVDGFYPSVMLAILSVFVLERAFATRPAVRPPPVSIAAIALFALVQVPRGLAPDSPLTGEGRLFSLMMFDARATCYNVAVYKKGAERFLSQVPDFGLQQRLSCDPVVYAAFLASECSKLKGYYDGIDFALFSRRSSDADFVTVMNRRDVCTRPPRVHWTGTVER